MKYEFSAFLSLVVSSGLCFGYVPYNRAIGTDIRNKMQKRAKSISLVKFINLESFWAVSYIHANGTVIRNNSVKIAICVL
jgi:hypothetical protein